MCLCAAAVPEMRRGSFDTRRPTAVAAAGFAFPAATTTTCRLGRNAAVSAELKIATPTSAQQNHAFRTERPAFAPEDPGPTVATPAAAQIGRSAPFSGPRDPFRARIGDAAARRRPRVRRETTCRRGGARTSRLSYFMNTNARAARADTAVFREWPGERSPGPLDGGWRGCALQTRVGRIRIRPGQFAPEGRCYGGAVRR